MISNESIWFLQLGKSQYSNVLRAICSFLLNEMTWLTIGWNYVGWTNERVDLLIMNSWSRWGENHDENVVFDEIPDHRSRTLCLWIRPLEFLIKDAIQCRLSFSKIWALGNYLVPSIRTLFRPVNSTLSPGGWLGGGGTERGMRRGAIIWKMDMGIPGPIDSASTVYIHGSILHI